MRQPIQIATGGENSRLKAAIRVTQTASGRETKVDIDLDTLRGIEDLRGTNYIGAPTAIHVAGLAEPYRISEDREAVYRLIEAAGYGYRIGAFQD